MLLCSEGYGAFCRAVKMLFLEAVSVLCFGQGSYESPTPELIEVLMKRIFQAEQVTQDLTPLTWEETDSSPVVRSVLLQLILMGRLVIFWIPKHIVQCLNTLCLYNGLWLTALQTTSCNRTEGCKTVQFSNYPYFTPAIVIVCIDYWGSSHLCEVCKYILSAVPTMNSLKQRLITKKQW